MPSYRVRPGSIPKHLKMPIQPSPAAAASIPSKSKPPIRKALPHVASDTSKGTRSGSYDKAGHGTAFNPMGTSNGTAFQLPRFRASREGWLGRSNEHRDAAKVHPYAKLRDPLSVRAYDWIVKLSAPGLLVYFLFWSEAGEKSDVAILRRWSEGFRQDVKDWWNNVPRDEEVDPQLLLMMEQDRQS